MSRKFVPPYGLLPNHTEVLWKDSTIHKLNQNGRVCCGIAKGPGKTITLVQVIVFLGHDIQWCFTCWSLN